MSYAVTTLTFTFDQRISAYGSSGMFVFISTQFVRPADWRSSGAVLLCDRVVSFCRKAAASLPYFRSSTVLIP